MHDALVGDPGLLFGAMKQRDGVERRSEHQDLHPRLKRPVERRARTIPVVEGVFPREPLGEWSDCDNPGVRMIASQRAGPGAKRLVQHPVVPGGMGNPLVEHRHLDIGLFEERLEIHVGEDRAFGPNRVLQRLDDDVDTPGDGADGTHAGVHHHHAAGTHSKLAQGVRE